MAECSDAVAIIGNGEMNEEYTLAESRARGRKPAVDGRGGNVDPKSAAQRDDWRLRARDTVRRPFWLLSWTWGLANILKPVHDKQARARVIRKLNWTYFLASGACVAILVLSTGDDLTRIQPAGASWWTIGLQYVLLWRFFEILYAFHRDAFDKMVDPEGTSSLTPAERVTLALRSYLELIFDFSLIYTLQPASAWVQTETPKPPEHLTDLVWYSANVITTSGGGGYVPASRLLKLLSLCEVFSGVILLVVCFTVYVSRAMNHSGDAAVEVPPPLIPVRANDTLFHRPEAPR